MRLYVTETTQDSADKSNVYPSSEYKGSENTTELHSSGILSEGKSLGDVSPVQRMMTGAEAASSGVKTSLNMQSAATATLPGPRSGEPLPDNIRAGAESLSGIYMGDVGVHYNSHKPAKIGALAYAEGAQIHIGPGQEKHLGHEAWHVVQQKQGRVVPTPGAGMLLNKDQDLETEANQEGHKILARWTNPKMRHEPIKGKNTRKSELINGRDAQRRGPGLKDKKIRTQIRQRLAKDPYTSDMINNHTKMITDATGYINAFVRPHQTHGIPHREITGLGDGYGKPSFTKMFRSKQGNQGPNIEWEHTVLYEIHFIVGNPEVHHIDITTKKNLRGPNKMHIINSHLHRQANDWMYNWEYGTRQQNLDHETYLEKYHKNILKKHYHKNQNAIPKIHVVAGEFEMEPAIPTHGEVDTAYEGIEQAINRRHATDLSIKDISIRHRSQLRKNLKEMLKSEVICGAWLSTQLPEPDQTTLGGWKWAEENTKDTGLPIETNPFSVTTDVRN